MCEQLALHDTWSQVRLYDSGGPSGRPELLHTVDTTHGQYKGSDKVAAELSPRGECVVVNGARQPDWVRTMNMSSAGILCCAHSITMYMPMPFIVFPGLLFHPKIFRYTLCMQWPK